MSRRKPKSAATVASRGARRARKATAKVTAIASEISPYIDLLVNPWTASLENAGCPDYNQKPIVEWREATVLTVTPEPTFGNFCYAISPYLNDAIRPVAYTGGVPSSYATSLDINNYSSLATHFTAFRPFAVAVKAYYMGQEDTCKGLLAVCTTSNFLTYDTATFASLVDEPDFKECKATDAVSAVQRFHGVGFVGISEMAPLVTDAKGYIYVMGTGLPNTACIRIELTWVGEFMIDPNSVFTRQAHRTLVHPPQVHAAANIAGTDATTATGKDPVDKLTKVARKAAKAGAFINGVVAAFEQYGPVIAAMM